MIELINLTGDQERKTEQALATKRVSKDVAELVLKEAAKLVRYKRRS